MKLIKLNQETYQMALEKAVDVFKAGGIIIFPTETAYGAGVDATNQAAVDKLLAYKQRREGQPLSIAVTDLTMAQQYVEVNKQAQALYSQFLPGPVTVVSHSKHMVANGIESEFGTLGIRIPAYQWVLDLVATTQKPMTATSANKTGQKTPYSIQDIIENISDKQKELIDLVIDAGTLPPNPPSTVIDTTLATPITMRTGSISVNTSSSATFTSSSEEDTKAFAQRLILKHIKAVQTTGLIIALEGPLGAGKTVFTKGLAQALDITETIESPTYSYVEEYAYSKYSQQGKLFHADFWKVESSEMAAKLGIKDWLKPKNIVIIEWFSVVGNYLKNLAKNNHLPIISITIEPVNEHTRTLAVTENE